MFGRVRACLDGTCTNDNARQRNGVLWRLGASPGKRNANTHHVPLDRGARCDPGTQILQSTKPTRIPAPTSGFPGAVERPFASGRHRTSFSDLRTYCPRMGCHLDAAAIHSGMADDISSFRGTEYRSIQFGLSSLPSRINHQQIVEDSRPARTSNFSTGHQPAIDDPLGKSTKPTPTFRVISRNVP